MIGKLTEQQAFLYSPQLEMSRLRDELAKANSDVAYLEDENNRLRHFVGSTAQYLDADDQNQSAVKSALRHVAKQLLEQGND